MNKSIEQLFLSLARELGLIDSAKQFNTSTGIFLKNWGSQDVIIGQKSYSELKDMIEVDSDFLNLFKMEEWGMRDSFHCIYSMLGAVTHNYFLSGDFADEFYLEQIKLTIEDVRNLTKQKKVKHWYYVNYPIVLPEGSKINSKWGTIQTPDSTLERIKRVWLIDDEIRMTCKDCAYLKSNDYLITKKFKKNEGGSRNLEMVGLPNKSEWLMISLAAFLTEYDTQPQLKFPKPIFSLFTSHVMGGLNGGWDLETRSNLKLDMKKLKTFEEFIHKIEKIPSEKIFLPINRTMMAFDDGRDFTDSLIDAIIVWEYFFTGGSKDELSYRVSMNMAFMLSEEPEERVNLQREIRDFYNQRSSIVHGGIVDFSYAEANRVKELTVGVWKKFILEYPDLINVKASEFTELVLGAYKKKN